MKFLAMPNATALLGVNPARLTQQLFQVRPEEAERTLLLSGMTFCASAVQILGRTVRDTLFLARYEPRDLPWMFIVYGAVSAVVAVMFARAGGRFRLERMLLLTVGVGAATYAGAYALIAADVPFVYPAFYVWADVVSTLLLLQVWAIASRMHTAREAKRLFGVIGAGGVLGTILSGVTSGALVRTIGTPSLLFLAIGLMAVIGWLNLRVGKFPAASLSVRHDPGHDHEIPLPRSYLLTLGGMLVLTFTVAQVADYQFKLIARASYDELHLAKFFSLFYAGVGVFALVFQLFATPRILERAGALVGLLFMPFFIGLGSLTVLFAPTVAAAAALKFGDSGFQFTINNASYQILYLPFPANRKASLLMLLDGGIKPMGYAAGGAALLIAAPLLDVSQLALVALPLVLVWLVLIFIARRGYVRALAATLSQRRAVPIEEMEFAPDRAAVQLLRKTLDDDDLPRVRFAAERLLALSPPDLPDLVRRFIQSPDAELRMLALRAVGAHQLHDLRELAVERLEKDSIREVRAVAAEAVAAVSEDPCAALEPYLSGPYRAVQAAAIAGLLKEGSLECVLLAGAPLKAMATAGDPESRVLVAKVIERAGNPRFCQPLVKLITDPDKHVRRAACAAARTLGARRVLSSLLAAARMPGSRAAAAFALSGFGDDAVPGIEAALAEQTDPEARRHLVKTLRVIGTEKALAVLLRGLAAEANPRVRSALWKAVDRAVVAKGLALPPSCDLVALLRRELTRLYQLAQGFEAIATLETPLLAEAARRRLSAARARVLRALEIRYRDPAIGIARKRIDALEPAARANAYEILTNVLDRDDKKLVLPYFEDLPARERLLQVENLLGVAAMTGPQFLSMLVAHRDDWLKICALQAIAVHRVEACREAVWAARGENPLVEYAAALAQARLDGRDLGEKERGMSSLLEKVVLLKGVSLFEEVPGEDVAALAQASEEVRPVTGVPIIREGEPGDTLYVVVQGGVRVERAGRTVARLGPGESFGELSVIDQQPRSATVIPEPGTELLAIAQEDFHELLADHPELATAVLRVMSRRLRDATAASTGS
jgi:MFS family permease